MHSKSHHILKGDDAPVDFHPDIIYKDGKTRVNHAQRIPHASETIRKDSTSYHALDTALTEICTYVNDLVRLHLPNEYTVVKSFVDVLPLNECPTAYPFPGFVLNLQVSTEAHRDSGDSTICVVIPFGTWKNGGIVLHEVRLLVDLSPGDILVFPSYKITHFNLHFDGLRFSLVMHSDKHGQSWVDDRNGWKTHIYRKESS
jgi:hypothetical protein